MRYGAGWTPEQIKAETERRAQELAQRRATQQQALGTLKPEHRELLQAVEKWGTGGVQATLDSVSRLAGRPFELYDLAGLERARANREIAAEVVRQLPKPPGRRQARTRQAKAVALPATIDERRERLWRDAAPAFRLLITGDSARPSRRITAIELAGGMGCHRVTLSRLLSDAGLTFRQFRDELAAEIMNSLPGAT